MQRRFARPFVAVAAGASLAAAAALGAPAASAASAHAGRFIVVHGSHGFGIRNSNPVGTNDFVAGYLGDPTGTSTYTMSTTFNVPSLQCSASPPSSSFQLFFINGTLAGGEQSESGVAIIQECQGTTPVTDIQIARDGISTATVPVPMGTQISLSASVTSTSESYSATIGSRHVTWTGAGMTEPFFQASIQGGYLTGGFPPFSPITYKNLTVDGQPLGDSAYSAFSQVDGAGNVMIQASPLAQTGKAFQLTYVTNVYVPGS